MPKKLDNLFKGHRIFVIGNGTSLRNFDLSKLDNEITIGMNGLINHYHPTVMVVIDTTVKHKYDFSRYGGLLLCGPESGMDGTIIKRNIINETYSWDMDVGKSFEDGFYGRGSGTAALHSAILLGGSPIYLLGYDFYVSPTGDVHFYESPAVYDFCAYEAMRVSCDMLGKEDWLPPIYNLNPLSRLEVFPFLPRDGIL